MKSYISKLATVVLLAVLSAEALADDGAEEKAKVFFKEGTALYNAGRFEEAATKFQSAYSMKPSWKLLYNIGQAEAASKRQGLAIEAFEKYLAEGGDEVPLERRDQVYAEIDKLRRIVGSVSISAPDGMDVWVDGVNRGTTPLSGRLRISASREHTIELNDGGVVVDTKKVMVAGQETIALKFDVKSEKRAVAPAQKKKSTSTGTNENSYTIMRRDKLDRQATSLWIAGWVTLGVGGASLIGGAVTGGLALKMDKEFDPNGLCDPDGVCPKSLQRDLKDRDDMAKTSTSLIGLGILCGITGTVLVLVSRKKKSKAERLDAQLSAFPLVGNDFGGLVIEGRF